MTDSMDNNFDYQNDGHEEAFLIDMPGQDKIIIKQKEQKRVRIEKRENNSGMGEQAPYHITRYFNWGACLFNWVWGIRYKKWALLTIPALLLIPYGVVVCIVMSLWAGINGNQWAWEEVEYRDEKDFHKAQQQWVKVWGVLAFFIVAAFAPVFVEYLQRPEETSFAIEDHQLLSSLELTIPEEYFEQTDPLDNHSNFITSDKHIIYWLRPDNKLSSKNKNYIESRFNKNKNVLQDKFVLYPDIKQLADRTSNIRNLELEAKCKNDICIDTWLYKRCNKGYCVINPQTRKYYKVRTKESLIPKAKTLINKW
jgi:hypothetical protein